MYLSFFLPLFLEVIIFLIVVGSITFGILYKFTDVIKKHGDNNDFVYEETLANYLVDFTGEYIFF